MDPEITKRNLSYVHYFDIKSSVSHSARLIGFDLPASQSISLPWASVVKGSFAFLYIWQSHVIIFEKHEVGNIASYSVHKCHLQSKMNRRIRQIMHLYPCCHSIEIISSGTLQFFWSPPSFSEHLTGLAEKMIDIPTIVTMDPQVNPITIELRANTIHWN